MKNIFNKFTKLFKNDGDFKIGLEDFSDYIKKHSLLIGITILVILLAHGINIFYNNLGIDSQIFVQKPTFDYNWIGLGRFGLLLERDILYLNPFVSYYAGILLIVFLILTCSLIYYAFYKISNKDFGLINLCIPLICFTHPVFAEQFLFKLQCAEVAFGAFLTSLSMLWLFTWIKNKNFLYAILGMIGLVFSFASYQSFVFIYITMCIFGFILLNENDKKESNFRVILKLIITFLVSYLIYRFIIKHVFLYLDFEIGWNSKSLKEIILIILDHMKNVITGSGPHYNLGFTFGAVLCLIIIIFKIVKDENTISNKIWYALSFVALLMSPFLLCIVQGGTPLLRSQLALPYAEAFLVMFSFCYLYKNKYLKYVALILVFCIVGAQMSSLETLYYTDVFKSEYEIDLSNKLVYDLKSKGINDENTIVIIGHLDPPFNELCHPGEIAGVSSYNANHEKYPYYMYSTANILGVWRCLGYDYKAGNQEQTEKARKYLDGKDIPIWPQEGSIINLDDFYIVKISNDDLPW